MVLGQRRAIKNGNSHYLEPAFTGLVQNVKESPSSVLRRETSVISP
jgi:hypothetical protein